MIEKLDFLVRFWELRARWEALGVPLSDRERIELLALVQLVGNEGRSRERGPAALNRRSLPLHMIARGGFLAGDLREVYAELLIVAAAQRLEEGERTVVQVTDVAAGHEYTIPCVVVWSHEAVPCAIALTVDGIPSRTDIVLPLANAWESPLGMGAVATRGYA